MRLVGSLTSPYVRRIRLLLWREACDFTSLDIFGADRETLRQMSPALKIPVLEDGDLRLFDSRVIARYLRERLGVPALSWPQENLLTLIDAVNDSLVTLFLGQRSELEPEALLFRLQRERVAASLDALSAAVTEGQFREWGYPAFCLLALLDWARFRGLMEAGDHPDLDAWLESCCKCPGVAETDPRLASS